MKKYMFWLWMDNDALKERAHYLEKISLLKWDIWFYYTGIEIFISIFMLACVLLGWILFTITNLKNFIDPFSDLKITYFIVNGIFIITLIILNCHFIFKGAKNENRNKLLFMILIIAILLTLISIGLFFSINNQINQNIDLLHEKNPELYIESIFSSILPNTNDFNYIAPFWIMSFTLIISLFFIIYLDSTWLYRLFRKADALETTDILLDEEENIKF